MLKLYKVIALLLICYSISELYFERISILETHKKWHTNLIEKGENEFNGNKIIWNSLSENEKKKYRVRISWTNNRINKNGYLVLRHLYCIVLNLILFIGLFSLQPWLKFYLVFWILSDIVITPLYYYIVGYDSMFIERFGIMPFGMKIAASAMSILMLGFK